MKIRVLAIALLALSACAANQRDQAWSQATIDCNRGLPAACIELQNLYAQQNQRQAASAAYWQQREANQAAWWRNQAIQSSIDTQTSQQALDALTAQQLQQQQQFNQQMERDLQQIKHPYWSQ